MYNQKLNFLVLLIILSVCAQSAYGKDYPSKTNKNNIYTKSKDNGLFGNSDCSDDECGPLDSLPRVACSDGSLMKIGACTRLADGTCSWTLKPCSNGGSNTPSKNPLPYNSQSSAGKMQTSSYQGNDRNQLKNRKTPSQSGSNYLKGRTPNKAYDDDDDYEVIYGGYSDDNYEAFSFENRHYEGYNLDSYQDNRGYEESFYNRNNRTNQGSRYNDDDDEFEYEDDDQDSGTLGNFYGYRSPIYQSVKSYLERHRQDSTVQIQNDDNSGYDESNIEEIDMDEDEPVYNQRQRTQYNRLNVGNQQQANRLTAGKPQVNRPTAGQQPVKRPNFGNQLQRINQEYNGQKQQSSLEKNQYNRPNVGKQQINRPNFGQVRPKVEQQANSYQNDNQNKLNVGKQQSNRPTVGQVRPKVEQQVNSYQSQDRNQNRPSTRPQTRPQANYNQNNDYEEIEINFPTQLQRYGSPNTIKSQITRPAIVEEALEGPQQFNYGNNNRVNEYTKEKQLDKIADVLDTLSDLLRELKKY